ncbi:polysaccharide deacetylase family protein [Corynebacterium riegelii]|uniref:polysaccharide deacetylase family protein n=1 Tax=Corynebacterium riegelii TaxID=156976 RepID=UPI00254AAC74|nr:polysaccharide deacetylase family protein [Corynebacterium riegelii]MDK7179510.1 polysaccharide deacetylase family protein [Corynebacterium riegelii]
MNRVSRAVAAALCSLALVAPTVDVHASASSDIGARSSQAMNDAWRQGFNALPPQVRSAIPNELRPVEPAPPSHPAPPTEPERESAHEPTPAPDSCANCVALTFDDGPVPDTERLLDILDKKNVKASFFVVGNNARKYPKTVQRIRNGGHTIGNHTVDHPVLPRLSQDGINRQLDGTNAAIRNTTGQNPRWMRPPYGEYDARVAAASQSRGMAVALWDVDTLDWKHRNASKTCAVAVQNSRPGSVVLMHDIHGPTVDAVPCIIDGLRAKGLRPVSLDQMITSPQAGRVYSHRP